MPSKRQLQAKMNEQRETEFRPRIWSAGKTPVTKEMLQSAIQQADEPKDEIELAIPDTEEIIENPSDDLVILDDGRVILPDNALVKDESDAAVDG